MKRSSWMAVCVTAIGMFVQVAAAHDEKSFFSVQVTPAREIYHSVEPYPSFPTVDLVPRPHPYGVFWQNYCALQFLYERDLVERFRYPDYLRHQSFVSQRGVFGGLHVLHGGRHHCDHCDTPHLAQRFRGPVTVMRSDLLPTATSSVPSGATLHLPSRSTSSAVIPPHPPAPQGAAIRSSSRPQHAVKMKRFLNERIETNTENANSSPHIWIDEKPSAPIPLVIPPAEIKGPAREQKPQQRQPRLRKNTIPTNRGSSEFVPATIKYASFGQMFN